MECSLLILNFENTKNRRVMKCSLLILDFKKDHLETRNHKIIYSIHTDIHKRDSFIYIFISADIHHGR